jgi:hypothetical protein
MENQTGNQPPAGELPSWINEQFLPKLLVAVFLDALKHDRTLPLRIMEALRLYRFEWQALGGPYSLFDQIPPPDLAVELPDLRTLPRRKGAEVRSILVLQNDYRAAYQKAQPIFRRHRDNSGRLRALRSIFPSANVDYLGSCTTARAAARGAVAALHGISPARVEDLLRRAPKDPESLLALERRIADLSPRALGLVHDMRWDAAIKFLVEKVRASGRQIPPSRP